MLYSLLFIAYKLLFNALTYYFSFKKVFMFFLSLCYVLNTPGKNSVVLNPVFGVGRLKVCRFVCNIVIS